MKYIILGIKDYCKDTWHDWLLKHIKKYYYLIEAKDRLLDDWYPIHEWKEGNVWHYIRQRKIAKSKQKRTKS